MPKEINARVVDGHEQADQSGRGQQADGHDRGVAWPWPLGHQPGRFLVHAERDAERGVDQEVDVQDLRRRERLAGRDVQDARAEERDHVGDQLDDHEADELVQVVEHHPAAARPPG